MIPTSVKINGRNLREDFNIELIELPNLIMPPVNEELYALGGRSGSHSLGAVYNNWNFSLVGQFQADSHRELVESKTAFLRWIDVEQRLQTEWVVGTIKALCFEVSGHRYIYDTGTVSVTNGSRSITGTGTLWTEYISANSEIRFNGLLSPRYIIEQIISDTQLLLSETYAGDTEYNISYEVERKRYLLVQYSGNSGISPLSRAFRDDVFDFSIDLRTANPYWVGDKIEYEDSSLSAGTFVEFNGIGTAPVSPVFQVVGSATNPCICACEMAFHCIFNGNANARTILNNADVAGTTSGVYQPTRNDKGIYLTSPNNVAYSSVPGYADKFSFLARLRVNFASTAAGDRYIFDFRYDADNLFEVFYDASDDDWVLNVRTGGVDNFTIRTTSTQLFSAGDEVEISGWYDVDGRDIEGTTYYGKIFVNGVEMGSATASITKPASNPSELYVGSLAAGSNFIDSVVDELALYVIALTDEDCISIYTSGEPLHNNNSTLKYIGTLASSDVLEVDSFSGKATYFDSSAETISNATVTGHNPVLRGTKEEFGLIYLPNAISGKFRVIYRPHYR